jgi:hypothetical protein
MLARALQGKGDPEMRQVVIEVSSEGHPAQRTKAFDVPEDGHVKVSRVFFVPVPPGCRGVLIRALRPFKGHEDLVIGEARITRLEDSLKVDLIHKNRRRGTAVVNVTPGLPGRGNLHRDAYPSSGHVVPASSVSVVAGAEVQKQVQLMGTGSMGCYCWCKKVWSILFSSMCYR